MLQGLWKWLGLNIFLALPAIALAVVFGLLATFYVPHAAGFSVIALLAITLWILRMPALPGWGSIYPRASKCRPVPVPWVATAGAGVAVLAAGFITGWASAWLAAIFAGVLAIVFYLLLLPRLLARRQRRRRLQERKIEFQPPEAPPAAKPGTQPEMPEAVRELLGGPENAPWAAPVHDEERSNRLHRWLDGGENPIQSAEDDLFDMGPQAHRLIEYLQPPASDAFAGTVLLIGARGSGKSTLLRLAAEMASQPEKPSKLRFATVSLWDHADPASAVRAAIVEGIKSVRDLIDVIPFSGAAASLPRALFGQPGAAGLFDLISAPPTEVWLPALSEALLLANARLIFCIEDADRIAPKEKAENYYSLVEGFLDSIKRYPGFGYIFCAGTPTWSEGGPVRPQARAGTIHPMDALKPPPNISEIPQEFDRGKAGRMVADERIRVAEDFRERVGPLPIPRLFQYQLSLDAVNRATIAAALGVFRAWMDCRVCQADPRRTSMTATPGVDAGSRQKMFDAFLADHSELGLMRYLTPRTLRNGLRGARRRWQNMVRTVAAANPDAVSDGKLWEKCPDPDSVVVACLILACFPERRDELLEHGLHLYLNSQALAMKVKKNPSGADLQGLRFLTGFSEALHDMVDCHPQRRPMGLAGAAEQAKKNWELFCKS
jgi:energy-coupling factor transporter ATP-binding protein EcfA2